MENASKALIIAVTTIIGVLLFYILVNVFREAAKVDQQYDENQAQRQLELANSQFERYNTQYNTIMDLITVCNLAYSKNVECDYDSGRAVNIQIYLENTSKPTFEIPSDKTTATNAKLDKNQILFKDSPISIYNLADTTLGDLGISGLGLEKKDKLSKTHAGLIDYTYINKKGEEVSARGYFTVYKYLFKCENEKNEKIVYDSNTGLVRSMVFKLVENKDIPDGSHLKWNSDWD